MRLRLFTAGVLSIFSLLVGVAHAAPVPPPPKGLAVSPARDYITVDAGAAATKQIVVANTTGQPLSISLSLQQFSVTDYTYQYTFNPAKEDWVLLSTTSLQLDPGKSQSIDYVVAPPSSASPGGHYFTLVATATVMNGTTKDQVQAASVLYVTVGGDLQTSSSIQKITIPRVTMGDTNFALDVKNTGNTHYFVYVSGTLDGVATHIKGAETTHLLLPQTVREVGSNIPAPIWPGIYTATYGYTTDAGETALRKSHIIYLPPWSILAFIGLIWLGFTLFKRHRRRRSFKGSSPPPYKSPE